MSSDDLASSYPRSDLDVDMKFLGFPVDIATNYTFDQGGWGSSGDIFPMAQESGELYGEKDPAYNYFWDAQAPYEPVDWSSKASSLLDSPTTSILSDSSATFNDFVSPAALGYTVSPAASCKADAEMTDQKSAYEEASSLSGGADAGGGELSSEKPLPAVHRHRRTSKGKATPTVTKSRTRSDAKPKLKSPGSSKASSRTSSLASSDISIDSAQQANSGHGGNHNIMLRTASRKPKLDTKAEGHAVAALFSDSALSPPDASCENLTTEERRARQNHNVVEKQYRNRLNTQFEKLLAILPASRTDSSDGSPRHGDADDRRMSKAEVLDMARCRIRALEQERSQLHAERQSLLENICDMQRAVQQQRVGAVGTAA